MSIEHWIWLSELDTDRKTKFWLVETFADAEQVYCATSEELENAGASASFSTFLTRSRSLARASKIAAYCLRRNIGIISFNDKLYPERLRNIPVPPLVLYTLGKIPAFDSLPVISVIGSRRVGTAERKLARSFAKGLAGNGMFVVSGMADGIDGMANMGAMDEGMNTAAVLGSGVDVCYPAQNRPIYERILSGGGCILSEYPPGSRPEKAHFPERNRIISGLSLGLAVIAAPQRSGALITAGHALEQGRDIFVVPGGIDNPCFEGSNKLIKDGAIPVTEPVDIVNEYRQRYPELFSEESITTYVSKVKTENIPSAVKSKKAAQDIRRAAETVEESNAEADDYDLSRLKAHAPTRHMSRVEKVIRSIGITHDKNNDEVIEDHREAEPVMEKKPPSMPRMELTGQEKNIYEAVENGCSLTDEISEKTGIETGELTAALAMLTVKWILEELPGRRFRIKS